MPPGESLYSGLLLLYNKAIRPSETRPFRRVDDTTIFQHSDNPPPYPVFSLLHYNGNPPERTDSSLPSVQQELVDSARWALGRTRLVVKGRKFNMDCSGVVLAIYYRSGIDLSESLNRYSGGGVQRLYRALDEQELLSRSDYPAPGDLLFWDNTYDRNGDGLINDGLTHIGMVVSSDESGRTSFIHHNYRKGIVLASMNLLNPDDEQLNSPMRAKNAEPGHAEKWLSSHLLRNSARAYEIKN